MSGNLTMRSEIAKSMTLDIVRYSQVWEDYAVLCHGLEITPNDNVLSIASSGCNVFALLLAGAKSVTAIDMSVAQIALVELKIAAIKTLSYEDFIAFIGVIEPSENRLATYELLRAQLQSQSQTFWDLNSQAISSGLIHSGRFDTYLRMFLDSSIKQLWPFGVTEQLLDAKQITQQREIYRKHCASEDFRRDFTKHASKEIISLLGRDPAQFKYVDMTDIGKHFLERFENCLMNISNNRNFYMEYCLLGKYRNPEHGPPFIQRKNFYRLKSLVDRITLVTDELESYLSNVESGTFNKVNLSDIFEYMSDESSQKLFSLLTKTLSNNGRFAYWTLLVPRAPDLEKHDSLCYLQSKSELLHQYDRTWFYNSFNVYKVCR